MVTLSRMEKKHALCENKPDIVDKEYSLTQSTENVLWGHTTYYKYYRYSSVSF
jgi:hypothetical protein